MRVSKVFIFRRSTSPHCQRGELRYGSGNESECWVVSACIVAMGVLNLWKESKSLLLPACNFWLSLIRLSLASCLTSLVPEISHLPLTTPFSSSSIVQCEIHSMHPILIIIIILSCCSHFPSSSPGYRAGLFSVRYRSPGDTGTGNDPWFCVPWWLRQCSLQQESWLAAVLDY